MNSVVNVASKLAMGAEELDQLRSDGNQRASLGYRLGMAFQNDIRTMGKVRSWISKSDYTWDYSVVINRLIRMMEIKREVEPPIMDVSVSQSLATGGNIRASSGTGGNGASGRNGGGRRSGGPGRSVEAGRRSPNPNDNVGVGRNVSGENNRSRSPRRCFRCGEEGHLR